MNARTIAIASVLLCAACFAQQTIPNRRRNFQPAAPAAPSSLIFVEEHETVWNTSTSPKTTGAMSVTANDVLVAYMIQEEGTLSGDIGISGGGLTWTMRTNLAVLNFCRIYIWSATASSTTSINVGVTNAAGFFFGANVLTFRNSTGIGAVGSASSAAAAPSQALVTTADNSIIVTAFGDWNGADGASRAWRAVNSITPTAANGLETTYFRDAAHYTVYGAFYTNTGTAGSKAVGISTPSLKYQQVTLEVKP